MLTLLPVILQLVEAGVTVAPQLIAAGKTEIDLFNSKAAPTQAQKDQIDAALEAALEAANTALQNAQPAA
jgi:hypothetical protein